MNDVISVTTFQGRWADIIAARWYTVIHSTHEKLFSTGSDKYVTIYKHTGLVSQMIIRNYWIYCRKDHPYAKVALSSPLMPWMTVDIEADLKKHDREYNLVGNGIKKFCKIVSKNDSFLCIFTAHKKKGKINQTEKFLGILERKGGLIKRVKR